MERSDVGRPVIAGLEMSTKTSTGKAPVKKTTYSRFMDDSRCGTLSNAYVLQTSGSSDVESEEEKEDHEATPKSSGRRLLFTDVLAAVNTSKVTTTVSKTLPDWKMITATEQPPPSDKLPRTGKKGEKLTPTCGVGRSVPAKSGSANRPSLSSDGTFKTSATAGVCLPTSGTPSISKPRQPSMSKQPLRVRRQLISCKEPSNEMKNQPRPRCSSSAEKRSEPTLDVSEGEREETLLDELPGHSNIQVYRKLRNTNLLLGKLMNEMRHTERRVRASEEERASTSISSSSSGGSGGLRKKKDVPLQVRVNAPTCVV